MDAIGNANWIDDYGDVLFRFAVVRVRDAATAEDLVQETLLAALRNADGFAGSSSVGTWLTGILKHKIIDHYRTAQQSVVGLDDDFFDDTGHWRDETAPAVWNKRTPENDLENKQLGVILQSSLDSIPRPLSTVFVLHEIEGLDRSEICELLGLTDANYWTMLHRARLLLRQEVERRWVTAETRPVRLDAAFQAL